MKRFALCTITLSLLAAAGCAPRPADRTMEAWLAREADSCLWYYTGLYPSLVGRKQYDSLERMYVRLLRAMPSHPALGPDTEYLTGWVITYYYNAQVLQDKTSGGGFWTV